AAALAQPSATVAPPYLETKGLILGLLLIAAAVSMTRLPPIFEAVVLFVGAHLAAWLLIAGIGGFEGTALAPYFLLLAAAWLLGWRCVAVLSSLRPVANWARTALRL
ncbi:ABC transporter permease, partial [Mesorhizobium sp. M2D.F.Ca.ET.140.01.1.1]